MRSLRLPTLFMLGVLSLPLLSQEAPAPAVRFEDVSTAAGLTVSHISSPQARYLLESMSGGIGLFDCDGDGKLDIVAVNGSNVDRYRKGGDLLVTLYRQGEDLKFTDITEAAGLTRKGWGMGVAVADFDNDGKLDLYVTGYQGNALYRNLGNCRFEDVTEKAGLAVGGFSAGAAWGDYDRDGYVDLFVARYVVVDMDKLPEFGSDEKFCRYRGILVQCGPFGMVGETDFLFRNRGDGTFEDVSQKAGVRGPDKHYGLGAIWGDYNNNGWPDLYVANDAGPNYLYRNNQDGTFEEVALLGGAALSEQGQELGSMGVDWGDMDRDGRMDMIVTNFAEQTNSLYRNLGDDAFADLSWSSRTGQPSYPLVGWGTAFVDFDNNGWRDIFVANGHVYPQVDAIPGVAGFRQHMQLFRNRGDRTFEDISKVSGLEDFPLASRRGAAFGDINNNGYIDIVLLNVGEPPTLLLNRTRNRNHRVQFGLVGEKGNRAAIGARVTVKAGDLMLFDEVRGGASYLSQNDLRLHFGLGQVNSIDSIEVRWPHGGVEIIEKPAVDALHTIHEGRGIIRSTPLPPPDRN